MNEITSAIIAKWIILAVWAWFGGITHTLVEFRKGNIPSRKDGFMLAFISGFAGAMWGLMAMKFFPNEIIMIMFASGFGGFMSLEGLAVMATFIRNKFLK
jgi:hypothetical protein